MQRLKTYSKRTLIGFLAVVFFSNVTFAHSLDYHFCQGDFESVAFFGQKASCSKMMEAEMAAPRSCCDVKKENFGLVFDQKSCCDNVQFVQDNVLQKPSVDLDQTSLISFDFIHDFEELDINLDRTIRVNVKEEIHPPPNIHREHSPENLQVFII